MIFNNLALTPQEKPCEKFKKTGTKTRISTKINDWTAQKGLKTSGFCK